MERSDFLGAVKSAVEASPKAGTKWDSLEALFSAEGLRGNGALNNGGDADRTTRARQLATSKKHKGHGTRAVASHSVFVIGGNSINTYDDAPDSYVNKVCKSVLKEHPSFESCLITVARADKEPLPVRLLKRSSDPTPMGYETWWSELEVEICATPSTSDSGEPDGHSEGPFTDDDLAQDAFISLEELKSIVKLLLGRRNVILQGPPGVGKSFLAKRIAYAAIDSKSPSRVLSLQFHPNYSYEEFVEGYRPKEGESGFEVVAGNLRDFVENVVLKSSDDELCVLILDELNRANLSSVLGEVMSLIESDKRGDRHSIQMVYSREPFFIPENLLVLGLMNTADRSIALVDYALRRRFAFVDLPPRFNAEFKTYLQARAIPDATIDQLFAGIEEVNAAIRASSTSLGRGFEIGHSYFCKCPDLTDVPESERAAAASAWLAEVLKHDIAPLLREYWFDDRDTRATMIRTLLGREPTDAESRTMVE